LKNSCSSQLGDSHERVLHVGFDVTNSGSEEKLAKTPRKPLPISSENAATNAPDNSNPDDLDWLARGSYWSKEFALNSREPAKRQQADALILCGHGVSLKVDANTLLIRNGFTHYPQKQETYRFFKGDAALPTRIIVLDGSGSITFDVLSWLAEQNIPLIRINSTGAVVTAISGYGYAANPHRLAWQVETVTDNRQRMEFCNQLIAQKIEGCILTLEKSIRRSEAWEKAMERAYADLSRIELHPPKTVNELRTLEANSAATYFRAWREIPLKWQNSARHPIPEDWKFIGSRTSRFNLAGNRNASHPVNAILNYAYAILQSQLQIQAVSEGYDPTLGIMHFQRPGSPAFIFDLMEPERPKIDRTIIEFLKAEKLHPIDFTTRRDGVVRLNPGLARRIAAL
jgi:CRISP-associated protein Cas1